VFSRFRPQARRNGAAVSWRADAWRFDRRRRAGRRDRHGALPSAEARRALRRRESIAPRRRSCRGRRGDARSIRFARSGGISGVLQQAATSSASRSVPKCISGSGLRRGVLRSQGINVRRAVAWVLHPSATRMPCPTREFNERSGSFGHVPSNNLEHGLTILCVSECFRSSRSARRSRGRRRRQTPLRARAPAPPRNGFVVRLRRTRARRRGSPGC